MRKLLGAWLSAGAVALLGVLPGCFALQQVELPPTAYHAIGRSWAYRSPNSEPAYRIDPGTSIQVVGYVNEWWIARDGNGQRLCIPRAALVADTDASTPVYEDVYYYPHRAATNYAPGAGPAYSLRTGRETYVGPRGGEYYYNGNGNRTYLTPQSTLDNNTIYTGPHGGQYYINGNGRKTYIKQ